MNYNCKHCDWQINKALCAGFVVGSGNGYFAWDDDNYYKGACKTCHLEVVSRVGDSRHKAGLNGLIKISVNHK